MKTLLDPFRLFGALTLFLFKFTGYSVTFGIQVACFLILRKQEMMVEALGWYGRSVTDAMAQIVNSK